MSDTLTCVACAAPCRASDRFCSQCGRRDPVTASAREPVADSGSWLADSTGDTQVAVRRDADDDVLAPGTIFARRYRIERMLGEGGMGRVYKALDMTIDEPIALKFVAGAHRFDRSYIEQFKRELKLARRIRHRNVVASFHLGEAEDRVYITQEYIEAESLSAVIVRRRALPEAECLGIMRQVLRGLRAAHDLVIVHRDIKPGNILVNKDGVAFILDFGLALSGTYAGHVVAGTPNYMAPELFMGAPATPSSDLYACGVLLFQALTGTFPIEGRGWHNLGRVHQEEAPKPIPADVAVSELTRRLYRHLVAKEPAERPQSAGDVLDVVEGVLASHALTVQTERPIALVADADEAMRIVARERLELAGYHVEAAATAQDAINLAFSLTPSLVVLDSNVEGSREIAIAREATTAIISEMLPQHGALALCRLLQHDSRLQRVPILVMSERTPPGLKSAFRLMGAGEVIPKPFTKEEFASGLTRARQRVIERAEEP